jgi:hypothetical protein
VTIAEEDKMWTNGARALKHKQLSSMQFFLMWGLSLSTRRFISVYKLKVEKVQDPHNTLVTIKHLTYTEHGSKIRAGSLHQVHLANKEVEDFFTRQSFFFLIIHISQKYLRKKYTVSLQKIILRGLISSMQLLLVTTLYQRN